MAQQHESWEQRISRRLTAAGEVILPARIAKYLENEAGVTPEWRAALRDTDVEAYESFMAIQCAPQKVSANGKKSALGAPDQPEFSTWMTTTEVAEELHVTSHSVGNWCRSGKLPATRKGRAWLIRRADMHIYRRLA